MSSSSCISVKFPTISYSLMPCTKICFKDFALVFTLTMLLGKDVSAPKTTAMTEHQIRILAYIWPRSNALYWPILCFKMDDTAPNTSICVFLVFGQGAVPMLACCWRLDQESR